MSFLVANAKISAMLSYLILNDYRFLCVILMLV